MKADGNDGIKISASVEFGGSSLSALFDTGELVSLSGQESHWEVNVGDLEVVNDSVFFVEVQNPPTTNLVNVSARNSCILATAYDGWFGDDQVEGFGCVAGSGVDGTPCDNTDSISCGDVRTEDGTWLFVR